MSSYSIFNTADGITGDSQEGIAVTGTNTYYSNLISNKHSSGFGLHLQWTGTPTGTFTFWVSDKPNPSLTDDTDWVNDTTGFTASNPAGSASKAQHNVAHRHAWGRIKYVNATGSGVLLGWVPVNRHA